MAIISGTGIMATDWANLPQHLLDSISKKIVSRLDYIRFSVVRKSWYDVAKHNETRYYEMSNCHHPPLLLILSGKIGMWNVYNLMDNEILNLQLNLPNKRFCGSSKGWLVAMNMNLVVTLINPFLRVKGRRKREDSIINLPPLDPPEDLCEQLRAEYVIKATVSADPILNPKDCIVMLIYEGGCNLAYIRLHKDITWTYIDKRLKFIEDIVYVHDKFFVVRERGKLLSFDITTQSHSIKQLIVQNMEFEEVQKTYLVVLNDKELWMIQRGIKREAGCRFTTKVRIFELNFDKYEWIEKKSLGDIALFLGDNFSISVVASNFSGCRRNCIYFNYDHDRIASYRHNRIPHDYGVYDVENKHFSKPYTADAKALLDNTMQPPYWVIPHFQL